MVTSPSGSSHWYLNLLWHSNSASSPSGYGNQTKLMTPRLVKAGYPTVISAFYGQEGYASRNADGILTLPKGMQGFGNDVIEGHLNSPHWDGKPGDAIISLCDPFVFDPGIWGKYPWAAWTPVDSRPIFDGNTRVLRAARWVWSMSHFGHAELQKAGFEPIYVPHGIESDVYKPKDRRESRTKLGGYLNTDLDNKFLMVCVAANKGTPSRKNFTQVIEAFALFVMGNETLGYKPHPDARLYIHSEPLGVMQGENLRQMAQDFGVGDKVFFPVQYHIVCGLFTSDFMNDVYNAADVFVGFGSEGFGIPTVEAQMAGCPVIVADYASSPELCFAGRKVICQDRYMAVSHVWWGEPIVPEAARAYEWAYDQRGSEVLRKQARDGAMAYDCDAVFNKYLLPAVERMSVDLARFREGMEIVEIPRRKTA